MSFDNWTEQYLRSRNIYCCVDDRWLTSQDSYHEFLKKKALEQKQAWRNELDHLVNVENVSRRAFISKKEAQLNELLQNGFKLRDSSSFERGDPEANDLADEIATLKDFLSFAQGPRVESLKRNIAIMDEYIMREDDALKKIAFLKKREAHAKEAKK